MFTVKVNAHLLVILNAYFHRASDLVLCGLLLINICLTQQSRLPFNPVLEA